MPAPREPNTVQPWDRPCLHGGLAWNHAMMTKDGLIFEANSLKQGRLQALTRQQLQAQATQNRERRWKAPDYKGAVVARHLFLRPRGVVDINACTEGQVATGSDSVGGAFTAAWIELMSGEIEQLDTTGDRVLTWREFFPSLVESTQRHWNDAYPPAQFPEGISVPGSDIPQKSQVPQAYSLPKDPGDPKARTSFGVSVKNHSDRERRDGVIIIAVEQNSAAERMGLRNNQVIWAIDGKRVRTVFDFDM